jgi:MazG family protein
MIDASGARFEELLAIMTRLRGPDGCPWDRAQTPASLKPYLIEEAYEVLEAIEARTPASLEEELGDVLLQVVFHAQIATERGDFTITDVLGRLNKKLIGRHPHVFGSASAGTPDEVLAQWEVIKSQEAEQAGRRRSVVDGVPRALPALLRAQRLQGKAARVNFDWPDAVAAWTKVEEETREAAQALESGDRERLGEELGDLMFSLVNVARLASLDAEDVLQAANEKFRRRFTEMEADLVARGASVHTASTETLEQAWEASKARERRVTGGSGR